MPLLQTIRCDVCGKQETGTEAGQGFKGWGALHGIVLDGVPNPTLCPDHLHAAADFIDAMKYAQRPVIEKE